METKRNLLLDGTLGGNSAPIRATMQTLREAGYFLQISALAVPVRMSRFGIYKRYEDHVAKKGSGRWVGIETHDRQCDDIPKTLSLLESEKAVDQIQIYAHPTGLSAPALLYDNQVRDSQWQEPATAANALTEGRNRPWTTEEQDAFLAAVAAVAGQMRQRGVSQEEIAAFYRYVGYPS